MMATLRCDRMETYLIRYRGGECWSAGFAFEREARDRHPCQGVARRAKPHRMEAIQSAERC
jgi:hypothetical protein